MGRKSKLTDEQWTGIGKRLLEGESIISLAREFGVGESTIRSRFERKGQKTADIRKVAEGMFEAEKGVKEAQKACEVARQAVQTLPTPAAQFAALSLFSRMCNVADKLCAAAEYSAGNALHMAALASGERMKIDEAEPQKSIENIKAFIVLQKASNEAAELPTKLIAASANRDLIRRVNDERPDIPANEQQLTPDRLKDGVRRLAFMLHRAAATPTENA